MRDTIKKTVSQADEDKIKKGFKDILKYGTPLQKKIVRQIQKSNLLISIGNVGGSASTGVADTKATQERIDGQSLTETQALDDIQITLNPGTLATQAGIEGTLVHETRHAWHQARTISVFSQEDSGSREIKAADIDGFTIEYAATKAYADYAVNAVKANHYKQEFTNEAVNTLGVAQKSSNGIKVNEAGIRQRLLNAYNVSETTRGTTFSQNWNLRPTKVE